MPSVNNTLQPAPVHSIGRVHAYLRIIGLPLAKRIRQPAAHNVRNTKTNRRTSHQSSCSELAAKALLPPSSKNQVRRTPSRSQTRAVGLEAVDVEV
jgi:hypothetical protein